MRVTSNDVLDIMDADISISNNAMVAFITAAEEMITNIYTDSGASTTLLMEIERWLVAHMIASTLQRMGAEEKVGQAQIKYTGKWGMGLNSTPYGQTVLTLDTTGLMAKAGMRLATITAVKSFEEE